MFDKLSKLTNLFDKNNLSEVSRNKQYSKKELDLIVRLLKDNPEQMGAFQEAYEKAEKEEKGYNLFQQDASEVIVKNDKILEAETEVEQVINNVVKELLSVSFVWDSEKEGLLALPEPAQVYDLATAEKLSKEKGLQFTGFATKKDMTGSSGEILFDSYKKYMETGNEYFYHMFRQGIDILDIDDILYDILSLDPNSMSKWLPEINKAAKQTKFFKIPRTKILRVPKALLQTTRVLEFPELTPLSLEIINRYASKVFELDEEKDYFVKTGTFSSKFDFRNTKVTKGQEVKELGSYLWFIQHQASNLASPLNIPGPVYGVSSNNEWVVREFIDDKENNPTIYNGLPLHTEYRVFVDFDDKEIIGINPYWDPDVMKKNFLEVGSSKNSVKQHDYIIYSTHEEKLMSRYEENKELVMNEVRKLLDKCNLTGQWSIDVMQNGDDFWLIDMARATESALVECVPKSKLKNVRQPFLGLEEVGVKEIEQEN